jgi:LacI family transcriptional regulator
VARATIGDIARRAGTSKATVSRVLNGKPDVDPETRRRIAEIVRELRYVPSSAATGLAHGRPSLIGMLVPSLAWAWVIEVIRGVADRLESSPFELAMFTTSSEERNEVIFERTLASGLTAGLVAIVPPGALAYVSETHERGFPVALIDDRGNHPDLPSVVAANFEGAFEATMHLARLGHRRIAFVNGPPEYGCNQERRRGYESALKAASMSVDPSLVREADFARAGGRAAAEQLLQLPVPPSAIFAANDLMALGAMDAGEAAGRHVPQDLSIVGFDDIPEARVTKPALTTIRQPLYEMGAQAVDLLLTQIEGHELAQTRVVLPTELVHRETTRALS